MTLSLAEQLLDLTFDPDEPRDEKGRWFHGTRGDYLSGQVLSGKKFYYTGYRPLAASYSKGAMGFPAGARPRVYEVEPVEGHERDPEYPITGGLADAWPPGGAWRARKIKIVREVSSSEMPVQADLAFSPAEVTLAWDHEDGLVYIDLAGMAWLHEARNPHTGEWIRSGSDIHMFEGAEHKPGKGVNRYVVPSPERLVSTRGVQNPADQKFFQAHPVSPENVVAAYDQADEGTREQGRRWYSDVHDLASYVAPGDPAKGGILLSTYSPQTAWPINMMNAHRSVARGKPIGPGEGMMVSNDQAVKAQKAMDGQGIDELMTTAKTHSFGVLIKNGDDSPDDPYGHVVIDTHAVNVAAGGTIRGKEGKDAPIGDARMHEYVADQYRAAAKIISEREGKLMKPHQLQAITWLVQQRANQAHDQWLAEHGEPKQRGTAKGRMAMTKNAWGRWLDYAKANNIPLVVGTTSLANQVATAQLIELASEGSLTAQLLDLAAWEGEPRDPKGRWMTLFHGAHHEDVPSIRAGGLTPSGRGATVTTDRATAEAVAQTRDWSEPKVVRLRIKAADASSLLEPTARGEYALKRSLPPESVAAVHDVMPAWKQAAREREYQSTRAARAQTREYPVIGPEHARGNSRAVPHEEFQALASEGNSWVDKAKRDASPITGLDDHWGQVKANAYAEARKSWGGATIDAHTGVPLASDADKYAISVKPRGMDTVSVPETATQDEFSAAMDRAKELFRSALERQGYHLGVFHDDEHNRIDIDPVAIVNDLHEVETVGAYTRAIGGAYHFKSGDGFWPPHVAEGADMAAGEDTIHFRGPGEWHSQAVEIQEPEPADDEPDED